MHDEEPQRTKIGEAFQLIEIMVEVPKVEPKTPLDRAMELFDRALELFEYASMELAATQLESDQLTAREERARKMKDVAAETIAYLAGEPAKTEAEED